MGRWASTLLLAFWLAPLLAHAQPPENAQNAPAAPPRTDKLPLLAEMPPRNTEQLLTDKPRDWIVLTTGSVLVVEPLAPRPDTINKIKEQIAQKEAERRRAPLAERGILTEEIERLGKLAVTLPDEPDSPEYTLPITRVQQIIHHEDHMIRALDTELREGRIPRALELLTLLQRNTPDWPGLVDAGQRILFADAQLRLQKGRAEEALVLLEELHARNSAWPQLGERLGDAVRVLCQEALARDDWRRVQFFVARLQTLQTGHPVAREFETELGRRAVERMRQADDASQRGDVAVAARLADEALVIQPRAVDLRAIHRRHADRYQILRVGVLSFPGEKRAYPVLDDADERELRLTRIPLFETLRVRDGTAYYRTRVFDEWEPFDLGRKMRFTLRPFRQPSELQGTVLTGDVTSRILGLLDPKDSQYDERLASFVESVRVISPREFEITFQRVPPRIEPLLAGLTLPLPEENNSDWSEVSEPGGFRLVESDAQLRRYVRRLPEPEGLPKFHVAEVLERRYESPDKALQGLAQGEISMLPDLPDWIIRRMTSDEEFLKRYFVQRFALPSTHLLQFHPGSEPLRVRELRASLAYAIDRDRLLRDRVLRDPLAQHGRLITTPFLSDSPANSVLVPQRRYDLTAAFAMGLAARKQLHDSIPPLRMIVARGEVPQAVAEDLARVWRQIGLTIEVIPFDGEPPPQWDILYRTLEMTDPVTQLWPFLTFSGRARIEELDAYPDWLQQELVQLDRTSDQARAVALLQKLHRQLADDVAFVPLWELDRFVVFRKNILGFPQRPLHPYDSLDQWTVEPWFPTELP